MKLFRLATTLATTIGLALAGVYLAANAAAHVVPDAPLATARNSLRRRRPHRPAAAPRCGGSFWSRLPPWRSPYLSCSRCGRFAAGA